MRWSKTIQYREKVVQIPLRAAPGYIFCPVSAISQAFSLTPHASPASQAFQWLHSSLHIWPLTYGIFMAKLCTCMTQRDLSGMDFGSHSPQHGGASLAFQAGVPLEIIKILGDWKFNAILLYLNVPLAIRIKATTLLSQHIPQH